MILNKDFTTEEYPNGLTITDPFAGSGTTLKVANDLGYKYIGYEIDNNYVDIINNRINK
jgi:DNA modification methylase